MKNYYLMLIMLSLTGCDLLSERLDLSKNNVAEADRQARLKVAKYKVEVREVKEYKPYHYKSKIEDPFRVREFLIVEDVQYPTVSEKSTTPLCVPPTCSPPRTHDKQFLENYSLDDLVFVGTLKRSRMIALIKTPDQGIVRAQVGQYMGRKNGKILAIRETAIVLQEKVYKAGLWEDKKTILMINQ